MSHVNNAPGYGWKIELAEYSRAEAAPGSLFSVLHARSQADSGRWLELMSAQLLLSAKVIAGVASLLAAHQ